MFFLGLLSTPMPYLLLAAFYFFGFAFGVFNNKTEEVVDPIVSLTIPVEVKEKTPETAAYYFQFKGFEQNNFDQDVVKRNDNVLYVPDTGPNLQAHTSSSTYDFYFSNTLFCRPPPAC